MITDYMHRWNSEWRSPRCGLALGTALLLGTSLGSVKAQQATTPAAAPLSTNRWETTAAVGFTLTRGNSETLLATLSLDTKRKWDRSDASFGIAGGYGEDRDVRNTEFVNAFGQYNRMFSDRFYVGLRADFNYDGIADLDYRATVSPLAGYYLVKEAKTTLALEVGPSVVFEKYDGQSEDTYAGFRLADRFEHKLSASTKIWQSATYIPQVDKWADKYVITFEAGIDAAITKKWSLRVVFQDIYDSEPVRGNDHNDMRLIAGTAYKF